MTIAVIPRGWQAYEGVLTPEQLKDEDRYSNKWLDIDSHWGGTQCTPSDWIMLEYVERIGEPVETFNQGESRRLRQAGRKFAKNVVTGQIVFRVSEDYFSRWVPNPGYEKHDICAYCGSSNGEHGELRQGWDCVSCGGN